MRGIVGWSICGKHLSTPEQEECTLLRLHGCQLDALGYSSGHLFTGRQERVALTSRGNEITCQRQVVGVVEDKQPVGVLIQPAFAGSDNTTLILLILLRELQEVGDADKVRD